MSWLLLHHGALASLHGSQARIPADSVAPLIHALDLLARAEAIAAETRAHAEDARARGYDQGFAEGIAAARTEAATELAGTRTAHAEHLADAVAVMRADITRLALEVVTHIGGSLAPEAVLAGLAQTALDRLGPGRVTVRVAPAQAPTLAGHLAGRAEVRVLADPTLDPLDMVLETEAGRALAGLNVQLAQVAQAWEVADAA